MTEGARALRAMDTPSATGDWRDRWSPDRSATSPSPSAPSASSSRHFHGVGAHLRDRPRAEHRCRPRASSSSGGGRKLVPWDELANRPRAAIGANSETGTYSSAAGAFLLAMAASTNGSSMRLNTASPFREVRLDATSGTSACSRRVRRNLLVSSFRRGDIAKIRAASRWPYTRRRWAPRTGPPAKPREGVGHAAASRRAVRRNRRSNGSARRRPRCPMTVMLNGMTAAAAPADPGVDLDAAEEAMKRATAMSPASPPRSRPSRSSRRPSSQRERHRARARARDSEPRGSVTSARNIDRKKTSTLGTRPELLDELPARTRALLGFKGVEGLGPDRRRDGRLHRPAHADRRGHAEDARSWRGRTNGESRHASGRFHAARNAAFWQFRASPVRSRRAAVAIALLRRSCRPGGL